MSSPDDARCIYDRLWESALESFRSGVVKADPHLLDRAADGRRGITLVARPDPVAAERIAAFIDELRAVVPDQHLYRADELHITVLTLISAARGFDQASSSRRSTWRGSAGPL